MATKVKGDKIKEGSIPLSALSSEMNIPAYIDFVKTLSNEDNNTILNIPYANRVVLVRNTDIKILNSGESTIYNNYGMTFTFTASMEASTLHLHIEGHGSLGVFGIKVYKDINKIKKEFLPDGIGGGDWNAQEGEVRYINNRTHYLNSKFSDTLGKGVTKIPYLPTTAAYFDNTIIEMPPFEDGLEISIVSGPPIYLKYIYEDDNAFIELIDNYSYFENTVIEFYQSVKQIESAYIPNTVIKTTPQTLTDEDKNQALSNLGIDPVVWKYLCNPHIVEYNPDSSLCNNAIPKELSDIIYQNGKFNHLVLSTILIKICEYIEDSDETFYKVERITSYGDHGNVTFNKTEFIYDTITRLFIV